MLHFCTLKTPENLRFSDVFRGYRNVTLGEHGLINFFSSLKSLKEIYGLLIISGEIEVNLFA